MSDVLRLKKSNCKNCYKCIRHCPVKSIRFSANQAHIVGEECILCGQCFVVCPQNAKQIADGTEIVRVLLDGTAPVVASLAPSFAAYFDHIGFAALKAALQQLGFASAEETALGATLVKREYEKQLQEQSMDVIISSCCHSVNLLIRKYYPELIKYLSPVVSPMIAHSQDIKRRMPEASALVRRHSYIGVPSTVPSEAEISSILAKTGKTSKEDELNCGSCGYNTCREKAIAVYHGKADISMCLPFLMDKAERFSNNILSHTPNGILVVNEDLEVQQVNAAAMHMLHIAREGDVLGEPLVRVMDPLPFLSALEGRAIREQRAYYAEFSKYLELSLVHDKTTHILIAILRDVTTEEEERLKKEEIGRQTVEIADRVVEKQMRIVQEIASLLGETTAETKIALTKLKDAMAHE